MTKRTWDDPGGVKSKKWNSYSRVDEILSKIFPPSEKDGFSGVESPNYYLSGGR